MQRYIIEDVRHVPPFNEPASLLTIGIRPLKIHHEDVFLSYFKRAIDMTLTLLEPEERPSGPRFFLW